jgi:hypothetical protein
VVRGDPVEPRPEPAPAVEGGELGDDPDQDLLARVLRVLRVIEHANREVENERLVAPEQRLERVDASGLGLFDQGAIVVIVALLRSGGRRHGVCSHDGVSRRTAARQSPVEE